MSYSEHYNAIVSSSQQCTIKIKDYVIMTSLIHKYRLYNEVKVDKCRSNHTELYNQLLQCYGYVNL